MKKMEGVMNGNWVFPTEDGTHRVYAELITGFLPKLKMTWDGEVIGLSTVLLVAGDLGSFQRSGHSFVIRARGFGILGKLVLFMDGVEVPRTGNPPQQRTLPPAQVQFIKEIDLQESEAILGTEEYPIDNRSGNKDVTIVHQVSRESTNEISVDTNKQLGGKVGINILSAIQADIEEQVSHQTGQKVGTKVTESQTLTFVAAANSFVLYEVVWKRKVLKGKRLYLSGGNTLTVPYEICYGLSFEVKTK
jgi:hypothetical protein